MVCEIKSTYFCLILLLFFYQDHYASILSQWIEEWRAVTLFTTCGDSLWSKLNENNFFTKILWLMPYNNGNKCLGVYMYSKVFSKLQL